MSWAAAFMATGIVVLGLMAIMLLIHTVTYLANEWHKENNHDRK